MGTNAEAATNAINEFRAALELVVTQAERDGVHGFRDRIDVRTAGLDHATRTWAMEVVEDAF
jgi:hypothetical protein